MSDFMSDHYGHHGKKWIPEPSRNWKNILDFWNWCNWADDQLENIGEIVYGKLSGDSDSPTACAWRQILDADDPEIWRDMIRGFGHYSFLLKPLSYGRLDLGSPTKITFRFGSTEGKWPMKTQAMSGSEMEFDEIIAPEAMTISSMELRNYEDTFLCRAVLHPMVRAKHRGDKLFVRFGWHW